MKDLASFRVLIFVCFFSACTAHLSNEQAEQLIKARYHFPVIENEIIETGLMAYDRDSLPRFYYLLQDKGMLSVQYLGRKGLFSTDYWFRVTLTTAAKPYITVEDPHPIVQGNTGETMIKNKYKTCEVNFENVEFCQEIPANNSAEIKYRVRRVNFTPFWSYYSDATHRMPDSIQIRPFKMIKTTNGWKADQ